MPSLSTLSLSRTPIHSPPTQTYPANTPGYFPAQPPPQGFPRQPPQPIQSAPEAQIQAWAGPGLSSQQPQPMNPPGVWSPNMDINFGAPSGASANSNGDNAQGGGTWNPSSGIRFG